MSYLVHGQEVRSSDKGGAIMNKTEYTNRIVEIEAQLAGAREIVGLYASIYAMDSRQSTMYEGVNDVLWGAWNAAHDLVGALEQELYTIQNSTPISIEFKMTHDAVDTTKRMEQMVISINNLRNLGKDGD